MKILQRIAFWWYSDPDHRGSVIVGIWFAAFSGLIGFGAYASGLGYFSIVIGIFALPLVVLGVFIAAIPPTFVVWLGILLVEYIGKLNRRLREWAFREDKNEQN